MTNTLTYSYKGRNAQGKRVSGAIESPTEAAAAQRLRSMGIDAERVQPAGTGLSREITFGGLLEKNITLKDLTIMSRQLATMMSAGLALMRALTILSEQIENPKLRRTIDAVRRDVEAGLSLSEAIARHETVFPALFINLVRAGETGGFLDEALNSVADNYEKEVKLRGTIKSALTYPIVVLCMAILGMTGMIIFIVPIFKDMFEGLGGQLPLPTQFLVVLSETAVVWLPVATIALLVFAVWWRANKHKTEVRAFVDPLRLKAPVFGDLATKIALARFTRNFGTMVKSGVPILQALTIVGATSGNYVIEKAIQNVQESVRLGRTIAAPLADEPIFPSMVTQMISVGEDSGSLEAMLEKISDFYDAEVESTTEQLTSLIEPLMIAVLGVLLGGMIVALYLPVFNIFTLVN
jgi:type IV pilus assembly protein PilC